MMPFLAILIGWMINGWLGKIPIDPYADIQGTVHMSQKGVFHIIMGVPKVSFLHDAFVACSMFFFYIL
jgi:hypothetical protein